MKIGKRRGRNHPEFGARGGREGVDAQGQYQKPGNVWEREKKEEITNGREGKKRTKVAIPKNQKRLGKRRG